jgi:hypothetical protein
MKLIIISILSILILIVFILFNIFIKNKILANTIESYYDNSYGAVPHNGNWGNGSTPPNSEFENNNESKTEGNCKITTFGVSDQSGKCLPLNSGNNGKDLENDRYKQSLMDELNDIKNKYQESLNKNNCPSEEDDSLLSRYNKYRNRRNTNSSSTTSTNSTYVDNNCYNNKTNFDKICRKYNKNFGIMNITPCDSNTSKVSCGLNYINGKFYGNDVFITPCINKSDDFDTWCKYYSDKSLLPPGTNVNSIGNKYLLSGKNGDCYFDNGKVDTNSARGVCDSNHIERVPKLEPIFKSAKYNKFTACFPVNTNFTTECSYLVQDDAVATQIMGYDCNPGFFRAKCYSKSDIGSIQENNFGENSLRDSLKNDENKCKEVCRQ